MLKNLGVGKGDRVALYLPMIPELPIFMLACGRIGATFTAVFSGFTAQALADRINDLESKVLVTADAGYRRGSPVPLKKVTDEAMDLAPCIEKCGSDQPGRPRGRHEAGQGLLVPPPALGGVGLGGA